MAIFKSRNVSLLWIDLGRVRVVLTKKESL